MDLCHCRISFYHGKRCRIDWNRLKNDLAPRKRIQNNEMRRFWLMFMKTDTSSNWPSWFAHNIKISVWKSYLIWSLMLFRFQTYRKHRNPLVIFRPSIRSSNEAGGSKRAARKLLWVQKHPRSFENAQQGSRKTTKAREGSRRHETNKNVWEEGSKGARRFETKFYNVTLDCNGDES